MAKDLNSAVLAIQGEIGTLQKNALNPHFKSKYLSLDALVEHVQPLLTKHGLTWVCRPGHTQMLDVYEPVLRYALTHVESGEAIESSMPLLLEKQNAQGLGSALTYARRYALCAVLNIVADVDDDGEKAAKQKAGKAEIQGLKNTAGSGQMPNNPENFAAAMRKTGKTGAQIRAELVKQNGTTLDESGITGAELAKYLNTLPEDKQAALLAWANG